MKFRLSRGKRQVLGIGLGVAFAGAFALATRYGLRRGGRVVIPEGFSPAIFARRLASTSHGEMVYQISGAGEPLVFLHGVYPGASSFEWSRVYPRFVLSREVLAADLVGFGESERPASVMDASDHAESLADFLLEACSGRPPVIVASGRTAALALLLASRHPERVDRLVLVVPQLERGAPRWATRGLALGARLPLLGSFLYDFFIAREPFLRAWVARFGYADASGAGEDVPRMLAACAQQSGASHAALNALRGGLHVDVSARLDRVPHPVSVLAGQGDPSFGQLSRLQRVRFHVLPPCGELAALEVPDGVAAALAGVLENPGAASGAA
jgi:pimeloyl-ACP methyl ester carboxylesterase